MARGSNSSYTGKQKRKAKKVAKSYQKRGVSAKAGRDGRQEEQEEL